MLSWRFKGILLMVAMFRDPKASLSGLPRNNLPFRTLNWERSMALVPTPRFVLLFCFLSFTFFFLSLYYFFFYFFIVALGVLNLLYFVFFAIWFYSFVSLSFFFFLKKNSLLVQVGSSFQPCYFLCKSI